MTSTALDPPSDSSLVDGPNIGLSLISAAVGVSLPYVMTVGGWRWRSTKDPVYLLLAKR